MSRLDELLQYARIAQSYGLVPIPVWGKQPRFRNWPNVRFDPNDPEKTIRRISHLYSKGLANNIAILAGEASGVVVVDVDAPSVAWWNELVRLNGLPETFIVQTGGGGYHIYFRYEPRVYKFGNMNRILGQAIEFRTNGGPAVFPGSISEETGQMYRVFSGYVNNQPIFAQMPDWLIQLLELDQQQKRRK